MGVSSQSMPLAPQCCCLSLTYIAIPPLWYQTGQSLFMQVVVAMIAPYRRVRTAHLAAQLNIPREDVEQLLVSLILDDRVKGRIDQVLDCCTCVEEERLPRYVYVHNVYRAAGKLYHKRSLTSDCIRVHAQWSAGW